MKTEFINDIYDTLQGLLVDEASVPGVRCIFEDGMSCQEKYSQMLAAYDRLCCRLNVTNEDPDVELIINSLLDISKILGCEMFRCGVSFAQHPHDEENAPD